MAQTVEGFIGNETVSLKNAATEATLLAMLTVAKSDNKLLQEMARKAGVDAKAIEKATDALGKQQKAGDDAGKGLSSLAPKASLLGGFMADMGASVSATMGNLIQFGDTLLEGKARASDFFHAFKDLPLGLGLFATLLEKAMKYQERNLDVYQQISKAGVGLGGSLESLRTTSANMYLTLDQYAEVMTKNADVMQALGGTASAGAETFKKINTQLVRGDVGNRLLQLGYSFTDVNNMLGSYLRVSSDSLRVDRDSASEQKRLAEAAGRYGEQLDLLARITGESREAKEEELRQASADAAWQLKLAQMLPEEAEKATAALNFELQTGGKGAADNFKARVLEFSGPFSKEGKFYAATMHSGAKATEDYYKIVKDKGVSAADAQIKMTKIYSENMSGNIKDLKGLQNVLGATVLGGKAGAEGLVDIAKKATPFIRAQNTSTKSIEDSIEAAKKKREADAAAVAKQLEAEKAMKDLSAQVNQTLAPVLAKLAKVGSDLVVKFDGWIKKEGILDKVESALQDVADFIELVFSDPDRAWSKIAGFFQDLLSKFFGYFAKSKLGKYLFGDLSEEFDRDAKINKMRGMDMNAYRDLYNRVQNGDRLSPEETKQFEEMSKIMREGRQSLAIEREQQAKELDVGFAKLEELAIKRLASEKGMTPEQYMSGADWSGKRYEDIGKMQEVITKELEVKKAEILKDAANIASGKEGNIGPRKTPEFAGGTIGTGRLIQDFGKKTTAELHGREAVLTEEQLSTMVQNVQNTSGVVNMPSSDAQEILANAILALNKQQVMANQLLDRIAENTRRTSEVYGRWGNSFKRV